MKKLLFFMFILLIPFKGRALAQEPFVIFDSGTGTLTFAYGEMDSNYLLSGYYGEHVSEGWDLNSCYFYPKQIEFKKSNVKKVEFWTSCYNVQLTDLSGFFEGMLNLTGIERLENLNTTKATNMSRMFAGCSSLTSIDLTPGTYNRCFNTSNATDLSGMFDGCSNLETIYCNDTWTEGHPDVFKGCVSLKGGDGTHFSADKTSSSYAHPNSGGYFTSEGTPKPYSLFNNTTGTYTFKYGILTDDEINEYTNQGIYTLEHWDGYSTLGEVEITAIKKVVFDASCNDYYPTNLANLLYGFTNLTDIVDIQYLHTSKVKDMKYMFGVCNSLTNIDLSNFDTSSATDMFGMFIGCTGLTTLDVSHFDTDNVRDMGQMFSFCQSLTNLDVSHFNTRNVTDMGGMFYMCSGLSSLDVSNFDTSNVTEMYEMFAGCSSLTSLNISNFNTAKVTDMEGLFWGCTGLTNLNISSFDTSNVTDMSIMFAMCSSLPSVDVTHFNTSSSTNMAFMFYECSDLTSLDVSNFNTRNTTDMHSMFRSCNSLTSLDISNFDTNNATDLRFMFSLCGNLKTIYCNDSWATGHEDMFVGCENLKGDDGTTYSAENTSSDYAHPNAGGYFTKKHTTFTTVTIGTKTQ